MKYDDLIKCGLKEEEITKPILAWVISLTPEIIEHPEVQNDNLYNF